MNDWEGVGINHFGCSSIALYCVFWCS